MNETVEVAKEVKTEFASLVNAVLRKIAEKRDYYAIIIKEEGMDLPPFLEEEWRSWIGEEELKLLKEISISSPSSLCPGQYFENRGRRINRKMEKKGNRKQQNWAPGSFEGGR